MQISLKEKEIARLIGEYQRLKVAKEAEISQLIKKVHCYGDTHVLDICI